MPQSASLPPKYTTDAIALAVDGSIRYFFQQDYILINTSPTLKILEKYN